jgi:uncharacterized protein (TIGR03067 family)
MPIRTVAQALLLTAVSAAWSLGAEKAPSDQSLIEGTWECVASLKDGTPVKNYVGVRAIMQGERLTWIFPKPDGTKLTRHAIFKIDPTKNPKHFDWRPEDKPEEIHRRLYVLEGNKLTWVSNLGMAGHEHEDVRPESLDAGKWRFVMNRVKPEQ